MAHAYPDEVTERTVVLAERYLRRVEWYWRDSETNEPVLEFVPPLTTEEQTTLARLVRIAKSHVTGITPTEWDTLEPKLAEIRTFRTRTAAEWSALTAAQRDNALIQWCQDLTDVLRAMLRD